MAKKKTIGNVKQSGKRQMKSRAVRLTLLSSLALAYTGCTKTEPEWKENPYDQYNYYGHAGDSGQVYSHYHNGIFEWFLLSRMFNGYGYYPPTYMPRYFGGNLRDRMRGGSGFVGGSGYRGYYSTSAPSTGGFASSAHVARGGFGSTGYGRGGGLG